MILIRQTRLVEIISSPWQQDIIILSPSSPTALLSVGAEMIVVRRRRLMENDL